MPTPRKHAELIHAFADGATIQIYCETTNRWLPSPTPLWYEDRIYRIKPENTVRYGRLFHNDMYIKLGEHPNTLSQLKITFEGNSNKIINVEIL